MVKFPVMAAMAAAAAKLSLFCSRFTNNELVKLLSLCSNLTFAAVEDVEVVEDELDADALEVVDLRDDLRRLATSSSVIMVMDMI